MHPLEKRVLLPEDLQPISSIKDYQNRGGISGLLKAREMEPRAVIEEVKASGLRGRGGAGFPTAIKWQTVKDDPSSTKYVVCNMAEGEPGTYKDRYLISKNPYAVFEGMLIAGHAVGAKEVIIATKEKFKETVPRLKRAIKEFEDAGFAEKGYIRLVLGPDEYLFGEEKALLEVIDGRDAMPRNFPPFMVGVGYTPHEANPTVVNNVESLSHVAHILAKGADWFRSNGFEDTPGTMIVTLTGDVKNPGMYEISLGITMRQLLYEIGGGPRGKEEIKAVFSGVSNRVMTPDQFDLQMGFGSLRLAGVGLGSGGFMVYDKSRSVVEIAHMFSHFLSKSSCGQCVPCSSGTRIITEHLKKLIDGLGSRADLDAILVETTRCTNQTRCFLPTQESIIVPSCMEKFPEEFEYFANGGKKFTTEELLIPKVQSFNDATGEFVFESDPKEFRADA